MDPAQIPQGAYPIPSTACMDANRLRYSAKPDDPICYVIHDKNTSSLPVLDDENLLEEILLRLPPKPSSLPRASLVCRRWRSILSEPRFLKRFRKHHCKPPLLGFFSSYPGTEQDFVPILDTKPNCIPAERFAVPKSSNPNQPWHFLSCRHGLAVLLSVFCEVVVWDPLTGQQHHVPFPRGLLNVKIKDFWHWHAAVLCADTEDGHVHGDCFLSPFKLVLMCSEGTKTLACLYESASGVWGNIVSTVIADRILCLRPNILIGNTLFWLLYGGDVLAFDTERQSLALIEKPIDTRPINGFSFQLLRTDDSALGLAILSKVSIQLWKRKLNSDGVVGWVLLQKIIQLEGVFPQEMHGGLKFVRMMGYEEDSNAIVLATYSGDFMLQLESMQLRTISKRNNSWNKKIHHPYRNFYTAGSGIGWKPLDLEL